MTRLPAASRRVQGRWVAAQSLAVRAVAAIRETRWRTAAASNIRHRRAPVHHKTTPKKAAGNINSSSMIVLQKGSALAISNSRTRSHSDQRRPLPDQRFTGGVAASKSGQSRRLSGVIYRTGQRTAQRLQPATKILMQNRGLKPVREEPSGFGDSASSADQYNHMFLLNKNSGMRPALYDGSALHEDQRCSDTQESCWSPPHWP